jgi:hypothetical protein
VKKYVVVQGCAVPRKLAPFLRVALKQSGARLQSCYRGADAAALLHALGKHTQEELWDGWQHRRPGFNPANPPGRSTHELRNDGVAYKRWPVGWRIPSWACGIDLDDAHVDHFIVVCARHGWKVTRTYPTSPGESHHVNLRRPPFWRRARARMKGSNR